ncbi:hypothetical protein SDC9_59524 [bioreactor metagenome]|uniref:NAD-specific glutamate dehydrogenase n=1 Tax=bioreactor metagenome TaxID=1076179 RepID=A0A644XAN4_9ZZZZ
MIGLGLAAGIGWAERGRATPVGSGPSPRRARTTALRRRSPKRKRRPAGRRFSVRPVSELLGREAHHRVGAAFDPREMHRAGGQLAGHVVAAGGDLALVEGLVRGAAVERGIGRLRHPGPHQAKADVAHQVHEVIAARQRRVRVLHAVLHEEHPRRLQLLRGGLERVGEGLHPLVAVMRLALGLDHLEEGHDVLAAVLRELATDEVKRLHAVRTLVDHRDPGVAGELRHPLFFDVAVAAIDLLRQHRGLEALVGEEALDDGRHQRDQPLGIGVTGLVGAVDQMRAPEGEGARALEEGLLVHQRAADVGVHDQRIGRAGRVGDAGHGAALQPVLGVEHRILIGGLGHGIALQADAETGLVHHREHCAHALVQVAEQPAGRAVIVHHAGRVAVDAHLLLDLADRDRVARAERAVVVDQELRHNEERDPLGALAAAGRLGQHQMDDVLGHVVIARRDEDLLAGDLVGTVVLRLGLGAHHAQIGAAMRLGQVHRAGPLAGHHLRQVFRLLLGGAMGVDRRIGAVRQALIHVEGHVGRDEHLAHGAVQHIGHALAAILRIAVERGPAALLHRLEGGLEALRRAHDAVLEHAALAVAHGVQRRKDLGRDLGRGIEHGFGEVALHLLIAGDARLRDLEELVQDELHVAGVGGVARHLSLPNLPYSAAAASSGPSSASCWSPQAICSLSSAIA